MNQPLDVAYAAWLNAAKCGDQTGMNIAMNHFMDGCAKPSLATF